MTVGRGMVGGLLAVWAAAAGAATTLGGAAAGSTSSNSSAGGERSSSSLRDACTDLVRSEARQGKSSGSEIERACAALIRSEAGARSAARQPARAQLEPRVQTGTPERGTEARAAFPSGGATASGGAGATPPVGPGLTGARGRGFDSLLSTDVLGAVTGDGLNAEYSRVYDDQFSLVGRARYSRTNARGQAATNIGLAAGFDYFVLGSNNQGLRVGPRLEASFGSLSTPGNTNGYGRLSALGEVGYNLVAANGLSGIVAGGFDLRLAGAQGTDVGFNATGNFSPYLRLGVGYSW